MTLRDETADRPQPVMTRAEFERSVLTYGADVGRWPVASRSAAAVLLASDAEARRIFGEGRALDAVLATASAYPIEHSIALADRIAADARRTPRVAAIGMQNASVHVAVVTPRLAVHRFGPTSVRGAALLAASLVLGVFVGQSQLTHGALAALEDATGIVFDQQATLAQAVGEQWDED